ncbi:MAG: isocitrate/isopropylmalate dehydrogenase family protein [Candidatus Eremiobacteraeota bacterium]|nr:isocitrate/isopropylmalate dehydrogenase family protein [Candidatus Eremiobacteraeota bacterium]
MQVSVVALGGDGTGPEVLDHSLKVLGAVGEWSGIDFQVEQIECGGQYYLKHGHDWPAGSEQKCSDADVILLGAVGWPAPDGSGPVTMKDGKMAGWSPVIGNRIRLDLYSNIRPVKLYEGVKQRIHGKPQSVWQPGMVDMVILRENTEDLYSGIGGTLRPGGQDKVAVDTRVITWEASEKVIRKAFEVCRGRSQGAPKDGKKRVTAVVKDNVMQGCKLFAKVFREVGKEYPEIEQETAIVDAFTQWLIGQPEHYDVVVTTNMFGDIVTDLASVLQGGMGMAVGCNTGDHHAMFEPIHGSAPKYAGQDKVNPLAMILSVKEALAWLATRPKFTGQAKALNQAAQALETSVEEILKEGRVLTYDLVGEEKASTGTQVTEAVIERLRAHLGQVSGVSVS